MEPREQTLETGSIYFFYRKFFQEDCDYCPNDIHRFFMVLNPAWQRQYRVMMVGKKKPRRQQSDNRNMWAVVRRIAATTEQIEIEIDAKGYHTKTRRERQLKAPRPVGHGLYQIVLCQDETHLVYSLESMTQKSEFVPKNFEIAHDADYILKVKNPDRPFPPGLVVADQQAAYPERLQSVFDNGHFSKADPTELLNYEGAGVLLSAPEGEDLENGYDDDGQTLNDFVDDLRRQKTQCRLEPLFAGVHV